MKNYKLIFAAILLASVFAIPKISNAQAVVVKDAVVYFDIYGEVVPSTSFHLVTTDKGNVKFSATFQLSPDNPGVPEKGVNKVVFWTNVGALMYDAEALIFADGSVKCVFHLNGSGNVTPNQGNN